MAQAPGDEQFPLWLWTLRHPLPIPWPREPAFRSELPKGLPQTRPIDQLSLEPFREAGIF